MCRRKLNILIVDDHAVVRGGLRRLFEIEPDIKIVGEAANGAQAIQAAEATRPDIVMMDLVMPGVDGVEATRRILAELPDTKVLVLTGFGSDEKLFAALDAGALGFLLKEASGNEVLRAVRQVARGLTSLSPSVAQRLVANLTDRRYHAPAEELTARETQILRVLALGHSNIEIAQALEISPATVRTHLSQVFGKLGLTRRTQAVLYALKHGIASLEDPPPN